MDDAKLKPKNSIFNDPHYMIEEGQQESISPIKSTLQIQDKDIRIRAHSQGSKWLIKLG